MLIISNRLSPEIVALEKQVHVRKRRMSKNMTGNLFDNFPDLVPWSININVPTGTGKHRFNAILHLKLEMGIYLKRFFPSVKIIQELHQL